MTIMAQRLQGAVLLIAGFATGCSFDAEARCDENMELHGDGVKCVCSEGYAFTASGCVRCRVNEVPTDDGCACRDGYTLASNGRCQPAPKMVDAGSSDDEAPRPPTGVGEPCDSSEDCAGTDATYCETLVSQTCVVEGCSVEANDCFVGEECCDLTAFGMPTLCVPEGRCP
jgi:hypothetical protein